MSVYQHIARRQVYVPVYQLCQVLQVAPSAYYAWQHRRQEPTAEQVAVRKAFAYHRVSLNRQSKTADLAGKLRDSFI